MRSRLVLFAAVLALHAMRAAAALTAGDAAAFRTILEDRFPGRRGTILVADQTVTFRLPGDGGVPLGKADLGPNVTLVAGTYPPAMLRQSRAPVVAAIVFRQPRADAMGQTVSVSYDVSVPERAFIRSGHGTVILRATQQGGWTIAGRQESFVDIDPLEDPQALRVGGDVKAPVRIESPEPVYTPEAATARISGIVILEITIDEMGRVIGVHVLKPLPFGLDRSAADAVMQWRFKPGTLNGNPVTVLFNITMAFKPE